MLQFEEKYWLKGVNAIAGLDEAGRGPLAGPVIAGAVVFDKDFLCNNKNNEIITLINDSKQLSEKKREMIFEYLVSTDGISYAVGGATAQEIDQINILQATWVAMKRAVENLPNLPDVILVDGLPVKGLPVNSEAIVKGDSKSLSIAAASIIAKVSRDRLICEWDKDYPEYGFANHKGYGSKKHLEALEKFGPCPIHRKTFKPVANIIHKTNQTGEYSQTKFNF